jgi:hypothetical protein
MKREEFTASGWEDTENYIRERRTKFGTAELKVPDMDNRNEVSNAVETRKAIPYSEFMDGLGQFSTATKIPRHRICHLRLGSMKVLADHNID